MKKFTSILAISIIVTTGLSALDSDWGGKLEDITQGSNISGDTFTQGNKIQLWLREEVSPVFNFYAKGGYTYRFEGEEKKFYPDLSDFYAYGKYLLDEGRSLNYTLGRSRFNDRTTRIMRSTADGLELKYQNRTMPLRFGIGYTGLVFNQPSEVVVSPADRLEKNDNFLLASPRLIGFAELKYPNLVGSNSLTLALIAQQDMRTDGDSYLKSSKGGRFHTQYFELGADGQIIPDLFYSLTGVLQTGQYLVPAFDSAESADYSSLGGMASLTMDYFVEPLYMTTISVDALYSTGDKWSTRGDFDGTLLPGGNKLSRFTPVSNSTKGFVYTPQVGNLIYGDLSVSVKPVETVQLKLSGISFFRAVNGPVSDASITADSGSALFLGQEVDFVVNYRPFSDLGFALTSGVFFPNKDILTEGDVQFRVGGYMSVSF